MIVELERAPMWFIPSESDIGPCPFPTSAAAPGAPCSSTIAIDAGYTPTTRILIGVLSALSLILVLELVPWLRVKASCAARARTAPLRVVQIGYALVVTLSGTVVLIDFHGNAGMLHPAVSWVAFNLLLAGGVCWMLLVSLQLIALVQRLERIVLQHPIRRDAGSALLRAARWSCSVVMAASLSVSFGEGFREAAAPVRNAWYVAIAFVFFAFPLAALGVSAVVLCARSARLQASALR